MPQPPIYIVAQYKCGTSWLLSALSAHPQVLGLQDVDVIRAFRSSNSAGPRVIWADEGLRYLFGKNSWCNDDIVGDLESGTYEHKRHPENFNRPQTWRDLSREALVNLYGQLTTTADPRGRLQLFLETVRQKKPESRLVLKAADQVRHFEILAEMQPDSIKIAITRDGRDASLSARAYERLMRSRGAPWASDKSDYFEFLRGWTDRGRMILNLASKGRLVLLRYEDLIRDFGSAFGPLLDRAGLESRQELVTTIAANSSFEAQTGRMRGVEAPSVRRKGLAGEWVGVLDEPSKKEAWEIAGEVLDALGYTPTGELRPLSPALVLGRS